jgi:mono/diheme cytochrome c family protein
MVRARVATVAALASLVTSLTCTPAVTAGDAARGRKLAELHCARCHVIGDFNKYGGIGSTPSFQLLVKSFPDYRARFETFFVRRPHPSFLSIEGVGRPNPHLPPNAAPIKLPFSAIADLLAFVETLKNKR